MAPSPPLTKPDLRIFLQQLQANPSDIRCWPLPLRISLLRNQTLDLTIYGRRIISVPRLALMAVSPAVLAAVAKDPRIPAINFSFDVPGVKIFGKQNVKKMSDEKIKHHEGALRAFAHWLTAVCTAAPVALAGTTFQEEVCLRFMCRLLDMDDYAQHLIDKFIAQAGTSSLTPQHIQDLALSCRGTDDPLLKVLAGKIVEMKINRDGDVV